MMTCAALNQDYAIAGQLQFIEPHQGLPWIAVDNDYATAVISVYGGQVLSYQPKTEPQDLLFLSDRAIYALGKAIRGGIPICWPWFGADPDGLGRSSHGFARDRHWFVHRTERTPTGATKIILGLTATPTTKNIWAHDFSLAIAITVGQTLDLTLTTRNTGTTPFTISQALHTYFQVGDIQRVKVIGLANLDYVDKVDGNQLKTQLGEVGIGAEVDRIYRHAPTQLTIADPSLGRNIHITAQNSTTAIIWNPWQTKAASMTDLNDTDYQNMICVETANADQETITITPAEAHTLGASYRIER